jgi:D-alanine-D-alanine ligase
MKVAVILGGRSAEREVSLASGTQVLRALRERGHEAMAVDAAYGEIGPDDERRLLGGGSGAPPAPVDAPAVREAGIARLLAAPFARRADVFFLALHGGTGEDGTLQALLQAAGVPFTGSDSRGSVLAMDKDAAKRLFRSVGVPTPDWLMAPCAPEEVASRLGWPVVVKPNRQGSTVGLSKAGDAAGLAASVREASRFDDEIVVERFIAGRELTVGVLEDRALAVGEILCGDGEIFDYERKYRPLSAREVFPAKLTATQTRAVQDLALRAHRACRLRDYSRVDFRMDAGGGFWCLEVNSLPGLTATSLFPQSAAAVGISFPALCERLCLLALGRNRPARSAE